MGAYGLRLPCRNFDSHHDELVENQSSKRDGDDVEKFVLKEEERHNHDGTAFIVREYQQRGVTKSK